MLARAPNGPTQIAWQAKSDRRRRCASKRNRSAGRSGYTYHRTPGQRLTAASGLSGERWSAALSQIQDPVTNTCRDTKLHIDRTIQVSVWVPARKNAGQLIAYAGANPGKLRIGFVGVGTPQHIGIEMFKAMADVDMTLVPYLGLGSTPALAHLLAGKIDAMFDPMPSSIAPIRAERLIPLAVTTPAKSDALPNVPSASDLVAGYQAGSWFGIVAPHQTPAALVERLNAAVNAAFRDPGMKARLAELRASLLPGSVTQFHAFIQSETVRYAEVIRSADISAK